MATEQGGLTFTLQDLQAVLGKKDDSIGTSKNWTDVFVAFFGTQIIFMVVDPDHG